jgi:hypothetical protein
MTILHAVLDSYLLYTEVMYKIKVYYL